MICLFPIPVVSVFNYIPWRCFIEVSWIRCALHGSGILYITCYISGESIPIRLFLSGYDLTPTMRDINKKFSVRYYINLVLVDEEDRRYFKQQVGRWHRLYNLVFSLCWGFSWHHQCFLWLVIYMCSIKFFSCIDIYAYILAYPHPPLCAWISWHASIHTWIHMWCNGSKPVTSCKVVTQF